MQNINYLSSIKIKQQFVTELPKDLYIHPNALQIFLEMFEGPLDLLLYLIKKNNLDILEISVAEITDQYILYINAMQTLDINLAADYLLMATTLLIIKTQLLLPQTSIKNDILCDSNNNSKIELINQLLEYEKIKSLTSMINQLPLLERDFVFTQVLIQNPKKPPKITIDDLKGTWCKINKKLIQNNILIIKPDFNVNDIMDIIVKKLSNTISTNFINILSSNNKHTYMIYAFLAILQLAKKRLIKIQNTKNDIILYLS